MKHSSYLKTAGKILNMLEDYEFVERTLIMQFVQSVLKLNNHMIDVRAENDAEKYLAELS